MKHQTKNILGMSLECWENKGVEIEIAEFPDTATIYSVRSKIEGKGFATETLTWLQGHYEGQGKSLCSSVALNDRMARILKKLGIKEYN